jgi:acyl-CoA synthetase (NDP forming)
VPAGDLAADLAGAGAIAARIGYPVALKAQAASLTHKSDAGGVILGIDSEAALVRAWQRMQDDLAGVDVLLEGVLVEAMAPPGVEMIVGARRDPEWGPVLMVGLGGIWVEALDDVRLMPADLASAQVVEEIHRLRGAPLLRGLRGAAAADVEALADTVMRIGAAIRARPEIVEIDVNPLVVLAAGAGVIALDALIVTEA